MDKQKEKQVKSVSIRFPIDLLEELHEIAQHNNRSLNGEVLTAVRAYVVQNKKKSAK